MEQDTAGGPSGSGDPSRWDGLALELQALRARVGDPSYAEIARRVSGAREAAGTPTHAARVARTTVYDAFRTGRTRVNLPLVREIAHALGAEDERVDAWVEQCRRPRPTAPAHPSEPSGPPTPPASPAPPAPPALSAPDAADAADAADGAEGGDGTARPVDPPPAPSGPDPSSGAGAGVPPRGVLLLLVVCVVVNLLGRSLVELLQLPVHLDMVGTAIAALALGPWRGAAVGLATNLLGVAESGPSSVPFALVNVAGALVWGYGARRWGLGRSLPRFLALNVLVAAACSAVAVPILVWRFDGGTGNGGDMVTDSVLDLGVPSLAALAVANLMVSLGDKMISGFVALVTISALPAALRTAVPMLLTASPPPADPSPPGGSQEPDRT
ncbi:hypothetical protein [Nocardioides sp. Leaf307]|uniref:hypothetical protein n=1 Tax=Nocardioides sp. Leaf307 TaxID=1736331 RepID=UPI00070253F8|nr:hypothetical protein [Nocardioides sp. Leaf307]KQQ42654.1 hypothetical protein ASF50_00940 [Nocardioides sp. Leaf307]